MGTLHALHLTDGWVEWGIAACAAFGLLAVVVVVIVMYTGWRPSW